MYVQVKDADEAAEAEAAVYQQSTRFLIRARMRFKANVIMPSGKSEHKLYHERKLCNCSDIISYSILT